MDSSILTPVLIVGGAVAVILLIIGIVISNRSEKESEEMVMDTVTPPPPLPASPSPFSTPIDESDLGDPSAVPGALSGLDTPQLTGRPLVKKCPHCAEVIAYEATHCKYCHQSVKAGPAYPKTGSRNYAGFWSRVGASLIDSVVLSIGGAIIGGVVGFAWGALFGSEDSSLVTLQCVVYAVTVAFAWLYTAGLESSERQATLGKMAVGLVVTDMNGARISFGRASARYLCRFFSGLVFGIGYLMVAWDEKKQGLHDKMAGTLVMRG